jgi:protein gp37
MGTKIEWVKNDDGALGETWNPIVGCSKFSPGCENCYAERMAKRLKAMGVPQYQDVVDENGWTGILAKSPDAMRKPFTWKKPRMIFVCSMSDLFHRTVPEILIDDVMRTICENPQHTFQILTKRPNRMSVYFSGNPVPDNVWVGVTAENQKMADERIPYLLQVPSKVRFVSVEPMLEPVDLSMWMVKCSVCGEMPGFNWRYIPPANWQHHHGYPAGHMPSVPSNLIHWVICGCESGPGARPMDEQWAMWLMKQCHSAKVPFFLKQMQVDGRIVKMPTMAGVLWDQMPELT